VQSNTAWMQFVPVFLDSESGDIARAEFVKYFKVCAGLQWLKKTRSGGTHHARAAPHFAAKWLHRCMHSSWTR